MFTNVPLIQQERNQLHLSAFVEQFFLIFLKSCSFIKTSDVFGVPEGRGSKERSSIHHESISNDYTNNWWRPQIAITWIYISVVKCILTCAIFTKICAWSLSEPWKTLFCQWKVKFWQTNFFFHDFRIDGQSACNSDFPRIENALTKKNN
jgi:hypothetical protein